MALPDKQILLNEAGGLDRLPDSDNQAILTAGLVLANLGAPLDSDAPVQDLITIATPLQCLAPKEVEGLAIRQILELLQKLVALIDNPIIIYGTEVNPNGLVEATGYALFRSTSTGNLWSHDTTETSNTGWTFIV